MADALIHAVRAPTWACTIGKQYGALRSTFPFWKTMLEKRPHSSQNIRLCNYLLPIWFCMNIKSILFSFLEIPHGVMDKDSFCNYKQTIIFFGSKWPLHQSDSGQKSSEFRLVLSLFFICVSSSLGQVASTKRRQTMTVKVELMCHRVIKAFSRDI